MKCLIERVMLEPEFVTAPPVLVDVGAAGGVPPLWQKLAKYSVVLAFEPDARETAPLTAEQKRFLRWVFVPAIVVSEKSPKETTSMYLTRSPQCSSTLPPNAEALAQWAFAGFFDVIGRRQFTSVTLSGTLNANGLAAPDWIKCDTQGTDLRIFESLEPPMRDRVLLAEFEPGLLDAYHGEDTLDQVLRTMRCEPFWLEKFSVESTPYAMEGYANSSWYRRLAPSAPGWGNLRYLRNIHQKASSLDRRALLLLWVFASLLSQPAYAYTVAEEGDRRFGKGLFRRLQRASRRQMRLLMARRMPMWCAKRFASYFM